MIDYTPLDLRRAEELHRQRHVDALYRARMRDATVARWIPLLYVVLALLGACGVAVVATSLGNGCGDLVRAPVALGIVAVRR